MLHYLHAGDAFQCLRRRLQYAFQHWNVRWLQLFGLMGEVGARQLSDVLPQMTDRLSPLFLGDHVVAL